MNRRLAGTIGITLILVCGAAAALFAGGAGETGNSEREVASTSSGRYNQAPALAQLVRAGQLPPVAERLPAEPVVITPIESTGRYGGTLSVVSPSATGMFGDPQSVIGPENVLRIAPGYGGVDPNIAADWEYANDARTLTLRLHPGIRWSDGDSFSADDLLFWFEDVVLNDELTPTKPVQWAPGGQLMRMSRLDDTTVQMEFAASYPTAINLLSFYQGFQGAFYQPSHYVQQFHPGYTDRAPLEAQASAEGFENWMQLFKNRARVGSGVPIAEGLPSLAPFVVQSASATTLVFDRNAYYWKVDTAGNQLPYVDRVIVAPTPDEEVANLKGISGELSLFGHYSRIERLPVYQENLAAGGYRIMLWESGDANDLILMPNNNFPDDVKRKYLSDRRFRIALSLGINRDEMNEILYFGLGTPQNTTLKPSSALYEERFATAYAEYDPERANNILDQIGLDRRDAQGWRLMEDGRRMTLLVEGTKVVVGKAAELIESYWTGLGIQTTLRQGDSNLVHQRRNANEIEVGFHNFDMSTDALFFTSPWWLVPFANDADQHWGPLWARWYVTGGADGEEPPAAVKQMLADYETMGTALSEEQRIAAGKRILANQAENLWTIGTIGGVAKPVLVDVNLRNVPESGVFGYGTIRMQPNHPETFYFAE